MRSRFGGAGHRGWIGGLIAALALTTAWGLAWSQSSHKPSAADYLASLRPGQWIQLDGQVRDGAPVWCTEVKQLGGDFLDDDWSIRGPVQTLDIERQEFTVSGCLIQVTPSTTYDDPHGKLKGAGDLRIGMLVDVEGTFVRNRGLVSAEVDDESAELARRPALKSAVEVVGRVEKVDAHLRLITVMGVDFEVTEKTKLRSAVQ